MLDLGIVIVSWNTRDLLRDCLKSVAASEGVTYQVVVVDNASSDGSAEMVQREFPAVTVIANTDNLGYPKANNQGFRRLGFEQGCGDDVPRYALALNPDTVLPPSALRDMVAYADADESRGVAGPKLVMLNGQLDLACRRSFPSPEISFYRMVGLSKLFPRSRRFGRYNMTFLDPDVETEVDSVVGAFMLVRREAIRRVGLFDETFFMYGEDLDWAYRIKQAGWKVMYQPRVTVLHVKRAASRQSRRAQREFYRAMLIFYRKHYRATTPWWLHSLILMGLLLRGGRPVWDDLRHEQWNPKTRRFRLSAVLDRQIRGLLNTTLVFDDVFMLTLAFLLGYVLRAKLPLPAVPVNPPPFSNYVPMLVVHVLTTLTVFFLGRMYHQRRAVSRIDMGYAIAQNVSIGTLLAVALESLAFKNSALELDYPRGVIVYAWLLGIVLVIVGRELHRAVTIKLRDVGVGRDNVLIIGSGEVARSITEKIRWSPHLGYNIVGAINGAPGAMVGDVPIIGTTGQLTELIDQYEVDEVIIALPEASHRELVQLISKCQRGKVSIKIYPDIFAYMAGGLGVDDLNGMPLLSVRDVALRGWKLSLKRGMDIVASFFGLVLLSPMFVLTAILIKLESSGPAFFAQERMGLDGCPFPMIKFRSMRQDAEKSGPGWTVEDDPRVTRMGRLMRKTNWDEMPQLINIFFGQMSLVGPRPEQPFYVEKFREYIPRYMERHREKAGMTGWAQVNGLRGDTSILERTKYDLWYVENWSLWLDIKIVLRTMFQTIFGRSKNAY